MDPQVVGVRVALLVVVVGDEHLRPLPADHRHQPAGGLVDVGVGERLRVLVGLGLGHARVAVAEHHDLVEADDRGRPRPARAARTSARSASGPPGRSMAGFWMSPSSPPVQHTSTVRTPSARVRGQRGGALRRLVVGVGVDGEDAERIRHGGPRYRRPTAAPAAERPPIVGRRVARMSASLPRWRLPRVIALVGGLGLVVAACSSDGRTLRPPRPTRRRPSSSPRPPAPSRPGRPRSTGRSSASRGPTAAPSRPSSRARAPTSRRPSAGPACPRAPPRSAIAMTDLDANDFVHWVVAGLDPAVGQVPQNGVPEDAIQASTTSARPATRALPALGHAQLRHHALRAPRAVRADRRRQPARRHRHARALRAGHHVVLGTFSGG